MAGWYRTYNSPVSVDEHRKAAVPSVRCAVITVSDTRAHETDAGHVVAKRQILRDEPMDVRDAVLANVADVDAIITTGGTGITSRDSTYEAVASIFDKHLDGFGELFRMLSYEEIGSAAMMTRATAGVARGTAIFLLPGSEHAVRLGMTKLILPELGHVVRELRR